MFSSLPKVTTQASAWQSPYSIQMYFKSRCYRCAMLCTPFSQHIMGKPCSVLCRERTFRLRYAAGTCPVAIDSSHSLTKIFSFYKHTYLMHFPGQIQSLALLCLYDWATVENIKLSGLVSSRLMIPRHKQTLYSPLILGQLPLPSLTGTGLHILLFLLNVTCLCWRNC